MMAFIAQAGYATAVVDFTTDLSSLLVGLIGLTSFSAAMIVVEITRSQATRKTPSVSSTIAYQKAA